MRHLFPAALILCSFPLFAQVNKTSAVCAPGSVCVDSAVNSPATDEVSQVGGLYKWSRTYPPNTRVEDRRFGQRLGFSSDIGTANNPNGAAENIVFLHIADPGTGVAHQVALSLGFLSIAPGEVAYGRETDLVGFRNNVVCGTLSICQATHTLFDATKGEGDSGGDYLEMNCWGGAFNGDDEGCKARSSALYDGTVNGFLPMGRVLAAAPDGSSVTLAVASLDGYTRSWGEGRYAVKVMSGGRDAVLFSAHALAQTAPSQTSGPHGHGAYGTVHFDPADPPLPVSTAWGQSTSYFSLPATNDIATVISVTSTLDGPGAFTNGVVCWEGGHRTGQGILSDASPASHGRQSFRVSLYEDPDGGANQQTFFPWFFQGGLCGTVARPRAFDNGIGKSNQALPFIGSTDPHTGVTGVHYHVGLGMIPGFNESVFPQAIGIPLRRYKGVAYITGGSVEFGPLLNATVSITGAANPAFNTSARILRCVSDCQGSSFGYSNPGPDASTTGATLTVFRDLGLYRFYSAARIVALKDPNRSAGFLGSYLGLEPHGWKVAVGDILESPATYSTFMTMQSNLMIARLPGSLRGHDEVIGETGANASFIHYHFVNANDPSRYQGLGGNLAGGPSLFDIAGPYSGIANFHTPMPGATMFSVGCSPLGCADPSSSHSLYTSYGNGAIWQETHLQYNNQVIKRFRNGEGITFQYGAGIQLDSAGHGVDLVNAPLHRLAPPTERTDAATRGYVDDAAPHLPVGQTPAASATPCPAGSMWHDDNFLYVCNAAGTSSKRVALSAF